MAMVERIAVDSPEESERLRAASALVVGFEQGVLSCERLERTLGRMDEMASAVVRARRWRVSCSPFDWRETEVSESIGVMLDNAFVAEGVEGLMRIAVAPSSSRIEREEAMRRLGRQGEGRGVAALGALRRNGDSWTRSAACWGLAVAVDGETSASSSETVSQLLKCAEDPATRSAGVRGLASVRPSVGAVREVLSREQEIGIGRSALDAADAALLDGFLSARGRRVLEESYRLRPSTTLAMAAGQADIPLVEYGLTVADRYTRDAVISWADGTHHLGMVRPARWVEFLFAPAVAESALRIVAGRRASANDAESLWMRFAVSYAECSIAAESLPGRHDCQLLLPRNTAASAVPGKAAWLLVEPQGESEARGEVRDCGSLLFDGDRRKPPADPLGSELDWALGVLGGSAADEEATLKRGLASPEHWRMAAAMASGSRLCVGCRGWLPDALRERLADSDGTPDWTLLVAALSQWRDDLVLMTGYLESSEPLLRRLALDALTM